VIRFGTLVCAPSLTDDSGSKCQHDRSGFSSFIGVQSDRCWSATEVDATFAVGVWLNTAQIQAGTKISTDHVWAVRRGQ
jgi:hypothetical protein